MKKLILLTTGLAALAVSGLSYAHHSDDHDDDKHDKTRQSLDLEGFDKIRLEGVYNMDVVVGGDDFSIDLSGRDYEMDILDVYLDGDTLVLDQDAPKKKRYKNRKGVKAKIRLPALYAVSVEGVGRGDFENIKADEFEISVEGVGEFNFDGTCGTLDVSLEGVGKVNAEDLKCDHVEADLEGVGSMSVYASNSIDGDAEGIGEIDVYGKPEVVNKSKGFLSKVNIN